jgi:hypothetical protein
LVALEVGDREQREADVAQRAEQSVQCRLVDDGAFDEGVPSARAAQREPRWPLRRISYRPGLCRWPADVSFMVLLLLAGPKGSPSGLVDLRDGGKVGGDVVSRYHQVW